MKEYYLSIFKYDLWANRKLIQSLKEQNIKDESVLKLLSHILISESVWMKRIKKLDYKGLNFWETLSLDKCETMAAEVNREYLDFIEKSSGETLGERMVYQNSKGENCENTIRQALTHVAFHSTYHRGQIAREIRKLNREPVLTDYIAFVREK